MTVYLRNRYFTSRLGGQIWSDQNERNLTECQQARDRFSTCGNVWSSLLIRVSIIRRPLTFGLRSS